MYLLLMHGHLVTVLLHEPVNLLQVLVLQRLPVLVDMSRTATASVSASSPSTAQWR